MNYKLLLIAIIGITMVSMPAKSQLMPPESYPEGTCELAAKDYRAVYGGDLIFIQPLKDNGAFDLGEYNGAWLNKAWDKERGTYYTYYPTGDYFNNTDDIQSWYKYMTGKKSEIYNVNEVRPPFPIIWNY